MKIKVLRAFLVKGERQEVGQVIEVKEGLALELIQQGRAERSGDKPASRRGPMTTKSAPVLAAGGEIKE